MYMDYALQCFIVVQFKDVVDIIHILQGYFTSTGAIIWLPSASEATLKNMGI